MDNPNFANYDWPHVDNHYTTFNIQMITPAASTELRPLGDFSRHGSMSGPSHPIPSLSPGGQGNLMLYSPQVGNDTADEGFEEFAGETGKPTTDFSLFGNSQGTSSLSSVNDISMFPPLASHFNGQFVNNGWASRPSQYTPSSLQMDDLMRIDEYEQ
jgi:hypothetical protein